MIYDHYWINAAGTQVFSSRRQATVPAADAEYQAWLLTNTPTRNPGVADLREALAPYGLGLTPADTVKLQVFQRFVAKPHLLARVVRRLVRLLVSKGTITAAEASNLLATDESTDPET